MKTMIFTFLLLLGNTYVQAQNDNYIKALNEEYTSGLFKTGDARILVPMDEPAAIANTSVFQYLQGRVAGLNIYYNRFYAPVVYYRMGLPAMFLDEVRVDAQTLASIPMADIAIVKIFRPPFMGSFGGANGAIAVYTRHGEEEEE